jgi:hypothetical protein
MHPLDGPRERVRRANVHIKGLQDLVQRFFRENLYEVVVGEYNRRPANYSLRIKSGPEDFPGVWSLLIGEIAHNLRAALDGTT